MTNGSANFRARQRVARKVNILLKLQEVLIELLDEDTYYDEWCSIGLPDGMDKADLIDLFEDCDEGLNTVYHIAVELLRKCDL